MGGHAYEWRMFIRFDCVVFGKSAYPPGLSVNADIPFRPPSAKTGREQMQQHAFVKVRPYSITSSARASSLSGTVRPSAFAVLTLMTNSNWVGCSTGISAGFAPRRIL